MSEGLRVLLITGEYPPMEGGVADFTSIVGRHLAALGAEVHVLSDTAARGSRSSAVQVHPLMDSWDARTLHRCLGRLRRDIEPQVVNIQYQTAAFGMRPAINLLPDLMRDLPCVTTFHDLLVPYLFPKAGPVRWWVNLRLARASAAVIVTNAEDRARLEAERGIERLHTIPIGSNIRPVLPKDPAAQQHDASVWRAENGIPENALLICYFGFLNASKGGEDLVEAVHLARHAGYDARLVMIGGSFGASDPTNRDYSRKVRELIDECDLSRQVLWTGHLDEVGVSRAFGASDVCVLPYRDGISFRRGSLMAALAHQMPVVSVRPAVSLPELVHGQNVWLVPPRDPQALCAGISALADNSKLRRRLAEGAAELSRAFEWGPIAERTLEVYRECLR